MWSPRNDLRLFLLIFLACAAGVVFAQTQPGFTTEAGTWLINSIIDNTPIGSYTPSTGHFTNAYATTFFGNATSASALANNVLQTASGAGCTTDNESYNACTANVNWPQPFPDTNYNAVCQIISPSGFPTVRGLTKSTSGVTVTIQNGTSNGAQVSGGALGCIAYHP
jgi:hypothetical protein